MQLEVWSRKTDKSMWLSRIGLDSIDDLDCEDISPSKDFVVTEIRLDINELSGISQVEATFSSDYGITNQSDE